MVSTPVDPQLVENLEELPEGYYLKGDVLLRVGASISNPDEIITTWYRSPSMSHLEALGLVVDFLAGVMKARGPAWE